MADVSTWWAPALAFLAGIVSFTSPCVFPLVPGYLAFVSTQSGSDLHSTAPRARLLPVGLFILGFAVIFTLLGAASATWVPLLKGPVGRTLAGGFVTLTGLSMLSTAAGRGAIWMFAEHRPLLGKVHPGTVGAFPLGMAFAIGWTPCVGPVLAGILALAATGDAARGAALLFAYSLGLGVPFLLLGLGVQRVMDTLEWVTRRHRWIAGGSGGLLVIIGWLVATGKWTQLVAPLARYAPGL